MQMQAEETKNKPLEIKRLVILCIDIDIMKGRG